jgi:hypothetical protein
LLFACSIVDSNTAPNIYLSGSYEERQHTMGNMLSLIATCFGSQRKQPARANPPANAPPRRHPLPKMKSRAIQGSTTAPPGSHPSVTQPLLPTNTPQEYYSPITMDGALLNTQSPLLKASIPTEIHLAIVKHLPLSAVVALTLTCKRFLYIVGTGKSWERLRNDHSERSVFYSLLERDLVDYYHRLPADTKAFDRDVRRFRILNYSTRLNELSGKSMADIFVFATLHRKSDTPPQQGAQEEVKDLSCSFGSLLRTCAATTQVLPLQRSRVCIRALL